MLDGWRESVGVQAEVRIAREMGKAVRYADSTTLGSAMNAGGRRVGVSLAKRLGIPRTSCRGNATIFHGPFDASADGTNGT